MAAVLFIANGLAKGQQAGVGRTDLRPHEAVAAMFIMPTAGSAHGAPLRETVTVAADELIPNLPWKRLVSHIVYYPPGASSAAHRHARSAFI
jgi:hypothetical protein